MHNHEPTISGLDPFHSRSPIVRERGVTDEGESSRFRERPFNTVSHLLEQFNTELERLEYGDGLLDRALPQLKHLAAEMRLEFERGEQRQRDLFEAISGGVVVFDPRGVIVRVNRSACKILQQRGDQLIGRRLDEVRGTMIREDGGPFPDDERPVRVTLATLKPVYDEVLGLVPVAGGSVLWLRTTSVPVFDVVSGELQEVVCTFADISERRRTEEQIIRLNHFDPLTGLPNRHLFADRMNQAVVHARRNDQRVALLYIDIYHFKLFNETLGYPVGDQLIRAVAERMQKALREGDTVARIWADDFAIVLPNIKAAQNAARVAEKIRTVLARPFHIDSHELFVDTCMGISIFPLDGHSTEDLLKFAETAMFTAKHAGRNGYHFFTPDLNDSAYRRMALESSLRKAIDQGELCVYYQPQVDMRRGRIIGMEALVRWHHPTMGLVSPGAFIPLAEETGLIVDIGHWVLQTACAQNKAWQEAGLATVPVAVNLSARQLRQRDFLKNMTSVLRETQLEPRFLELELTESSIVYNLEESIVMMRKMKEMGVQISIDDFGTGYSSLAHLRNFPVDTLKIDQSFLLDISREPALPPQNAVIVRAIVELARGLKLKVIADGVETEAQLDFLQSLQCNEVQGYFFSRPLPPDEFEVLLRRNNPYRPHL